jgi:hypothetical protein
MIRLFLKHLLTLSLALWQLSEGHDEAGEGAARPVVGPTWSLQVALVLGWGFHRALGQNRMGGVGRSISRNQNGGLQAAQVLCREVWEVRQGLEELMWGVKVHPHGGRCW